MPRYPRGAHAAQLPLIGYLDLAAPVSRRHRDRRHARLVEAHDLAAFAALEVRVRVARMIVPRGGEAPDAVVAGHLVRQTLGGQPLEHAIERHAVDVAVLRQPLLDVMVGQRLPRFEQAGERGGARPRDAGAALRQQRLRGSRPRSALARGHPPWRHFSISRSIASAT